jgi:hypothetical protein
MITAFPGGLIDLTDVPDDEWASVSNKEYHLDFGMIFGLPDREELNCSNSG